MKWIKTFLYKTQEFDGLRPLNQIGRTKCKRGNDVAQPSCPTIFLIMFYI